MTTETFSPLPVSGYKPQNADDIAMANELKEAEERYLRILDRMAKITTVIDGKSHNAYDVRCIALARTNMQQTNMWAVRAVFQPKRISLPEDDQ